MDCREARRLLDRGVQPGSATSEQAALGFHLADCPTCRAYQPHSDDDVLQALLTLPISEPAVSFPPARQRQRKRVPQLVRKASLALLIVMSLGVIYAVGRTAFALATIGRNVQAMSLPSATIGRITQVQALSDATETLPTPVMQIQASTPVPSPSVRPTSKPVQSSLAVPTLLPTSAVTARPNDVAITVLLLGSDGRPDETDPSRSDAIVIARLDPEQRRVALLSLPRDLVVPIPGYGAARINAASVYGAANGGPNGGIDLMRRTVSLLLNTPIDYVVSVNFEGFVGAVDAIGGITVDVDHELYDPAYPTMDYGYTVAHFLPGEQHMDGTTALMYSRVRHMDSDFERMRRQQTVLLGIMNRLREQNILDQVQSVAAITTALRDYVQTDLPQNRAISLAWAFRNLDPASVERYTLDANMVTMGNSSDPYAEYARPGAIRQLTQELLNGPVAR